MVAHSSFVIERRLAAPVARVFAAWSTPALKRQWNACHDDWRCEEHELDFRPGGSELNRTREPNGVVHLMRAHYFDVVPDQRIVYAYEMLLDETRISASLVTVTFVAQAAKATLMTFTEQVAFLDGHGHGDVTDPGAALAERRRGTLIGLEALQRLVTA